MIDVFVVNLTMVGFSIADCGLRIVDCGLWFESHGNPKSTIHNSVQAKKHESDEVGSTPY